MKKLTSLILASGLGLLGIAVHGATKPNLIVVMADDLGYADVGFNGSKDIPTPAIDSIAAGGAKFTSAYTTYSVCGPSRAGFITGRYGQRFGFERNPQYQIADPNMGLPRSEETIADVLKKVGYTSGVIGKWHLGAHETLHPLERGFDFFYGHLGGGHRYLPEDLTIRRSEDAEGEAESYTTWILRNHEPVPPTKYLTDAFSDAAVEFIETNQENPFFLFLSYNAPHTPLQATEKYLSRFPKIKDPKRKTYAAMVSAVDDGVGRVLAKLRELGIEENTLVFFLSDNGGPTNKNASNNAPLRGRKSDPWEGGFRVPFAFKYPAGLKAGTVFDQPVSSLDILATIADLTNAPIAAERPLDGVNLLPFLAGDREGAPHEMIYLRKYDQQRYAIRHGDYKLVIPAEDRRAELYNLKADIGETTNIAKAHPEIAKDLNKRLEDWTSELIDPIFLGLIHTESFQRSQQRQREAREANGGDNDIE